METGHASPYRLRTTALVNLAAVLERCDEQMLPAVYRWIGASWSATPTQLGYITLSRALVQALTAPVGGIAGHFLHRGTVIGCGCLLWALCTATFACLHSLEAGVAVWAVNGFGLALVLPNTQSLTADLFAAVQRGRAFGLLYLTGALGGMLGALGATNLGAHRPLGLEGWRFAFLALAAVSAATGVANLLLTEDPPREAQRQQQQRQRQLGRLPLLAPGRQPGSLEEPAEAVADAPAGPGEGDEGQTAPLQHHSVTVLPIEGGSGASTPRPPPTPPETPRPPAAVLHYSSSLAAGSLRHRRQRAVAQLREVTSEIGAVLRIPTFLLIVAQGICGSIPWSALVFLTLYFQLVGMSDAQASALVALFLAGTAFGGLLGGFVGDAAAKRWPLHGRIAITQFSVGVGIPFAFLVFKGLPRDGSAATVAIYTVVLISFALLKAWPAPACNNPIFAEIVPPSQRNLVYSFDRCFEGAVAACAAPLVGVLSERVFGFSGRGTVTHDRQRDLANATALGNALLAFLVVPWTFTLLLYTSLHWSYPADKAAALRVARSALRKRSRPLEEPGVLLDRLSSNDASPTLDTAALSRLTTAISSVIELAAPPAAAAEGEEERLLAGMVGGDSSGGGGRAGGGGHFARAI